MDRRIKRVLRDILNESKTGLLFGDAIASRFFRKGQCALLLDDENHCCQVLLRDSNLEHKTILILTELLGTMNQLEQDASILLLEDCFHKGVDLFYEGKKDLAQATLPGEYVLSPGSKLFFISGQPASIDEMLHGTEVPDPLIDSFFRLFRGRVFPTAALVRFIKHGYRTDAQYDTMRALRLNRIAILVAIFLGLAPFIERKIHGTSRVEDQSEVIHPIDTLQNTQ